jgi:hypothetical protein
MIRVSKRYITKWYGFKTVHVKKWYTVEKRYVTKWYIIIITVPNVMDWLGVKPNLTQSWIWSVTTNRTPPTHGLVGAFFC